MPWDMVASVPGRRESRDKSKNTARATVRSEHDVPFTCTDGEGVTGKCLECDCKIFSLIPEALTKDKDDNPKCTCGHSQLGYKDPSKRNHAGHDHMYVLLGCGSEQLIRPKGIQWWEAFTFWYDQFQRSPTSTAFVGFFLGYDYTQLFKTLSWKKARVLYVDDVIKQIRTPEKVGENGKRINPIPWPVEEIDPTGQRWKFDILPPSNRLKILPAGCECQGKPCEHLDRRGNKNAWMYICDSGAFFQASLLTVVNPYQEDGITLVPNPVVTESEYQDLKTGKERRSDAILDEEMMYYNRLENEVFARIMNRLNNGFHKLGIDLARDQWFGPGQAAQMWVRNLGTILTTDDLKTVVPAWVQNLAKMTYYGGWFEIFAHGHVPGISYEYDINSAYPFIMAKLPCLEHGTWKQGRGRPGKLAPGNLRMINVVVEGNSGYVGPLPYRTKSGSSQRPKRMSGWYWQHELDAARRAGLVRKTEVREWAEYIPCECPPPLRGLEGLYEHRLRVGKNTWEGVGAKLVYNSMYGKFAQSKGDPKYGNPIYASLITAGCRIMILDAIATHPSGIEALLMVATDAVYFRTPHPGLELDGKKLGLWEETPKHNLTLFKPGVYWDDKARKDIREGRKPKFKSRGVNPRYMADIISVADKEFSQWEPKYDAAGNYWYLDAEFPRVPFTIGFSVMSVQQVAQWSSSKWEQAGRVKTLNTAQDSDITLKRYGASLEYISDEACVDYGLYRSTVKGEGDDGLETTPYSKDFGWTLDEYRKEQYGLTPDGYASASLSQALTGD